MTLIRSFAAAALLLCGCGLKACGARQCETSKACARDGACSVRFVKTGDGPWRCYAGSDGDCAPSQGCKDDHRCFATEVGTCVERAQVEAHRCENDKVCAHRGDCAPSGEGFCVARDEEGCRASQICADAGKCSFVKGGAAFGGLPRCAVTDARDCEASAGCRERGDCGIWRGSGVQHCAPTEDAHCEQSTSCKEEQACERVPGRMLQQGRCVFIPSSDEDCAQSPGCRRHGACSMVEPRNSKDPAVCEPTEAAHCEQSEDCKQDRKCTYWPRPGRKGKREPGGSCGW